MMLSKQRTNQFDAVADNDNFGVIPDVKPRQKAENESDERVDC